MSGRLLLAGARVGARVADVLVEHGRVARIGPGLDAAGAEVIAADGRMLLRGLRDEHVHLTQAALAADRLPLGGLPSAVAVAEAVRRAVHGLPPGALLVGAGFQDALWPDVPSAALLDAASPDRPVVLQSHDIHAVWLNSAAARRFGVEAGVLREQAAFGVGAALNGQQAADADRAVSRLARHAASLGVTSVVDFEMAPNHAVWTRRIAEGFDLLRIEAAIYPQFIDEPRPPDSGLLSTGPLKALVDGALNTRTARLAEPYPDGSLGLLEIPPDALRGLLAHARDEGLVPAIHAIGDAAVTEALDAFEAVGTGGRIEHAQLVATADLPRFAALGVTASVQPAHLLDDREAIARHWPGREDRAYAFRSLRDAGAMLRFGSDAPVAPLDPWLAIHAATDRSRPDEPAWHPEQRIPLAAALDASTGGRATPREGDVADLVLIEEPPERMHAGSVALTLLGGRATHRRL